MGLMDNLQSYVGKLSSGRVSFDPSCFDDPLALDTEWTPLKRGGANFCTHKLYQSDFDRYEFRVTIFARLFCSIFLLVGLGTMFVPPIINILKGRSLWQGFETIFLFLFGLVFAFVGYMLLVHYIVPIAFDKKNGYFWKGRKSPDYIVNVDVIKHVVLLDNIHAIQLISERCKGENGFYLSYELNLVLEDASRMNVIDHGNKTSIIQDANKLSFFLGVPVWNAMD